MATTRNTDELLLRLCIRLVSPTPGVIFAVQKGKADLEQPVTAGAADVLFTVPLRVRPSATGTGFTFLGEFAQGTPQERFIYINSGVRAGQTGTPWERRAKLKLEFVPEKLLRSAAGATNKAIEASFPGTSSDGGPVCASLTAASIQWRIVESVA
jgi:hypothetical protein